MAHDASATWSGFNYQGKVGLYHALKIMNEKLEAENDFDFSSYELVYENHEDFDIKINGTIKSIHQVKAYNSTTFSDYSNAILETILEIHTNNFDTTKCFLHTWKPVEFCENKIWKKFKLLNEKLEDKGIRKDSLIEEVIKKLREEDVITETGSKKKKISEEHAKLIRNKYKQITVEKVIESINKLLEDDSAISRFKIYEYSANENCCELNAINEKITSAIQIYRKLKGLPCGKTIVDRCFVYFLGYIDDHIIQRHLTIKKPIEKPKPIPITFIKLSEIIESKNIGDASSSFLHYEFKSFFYDSFNEFIKNPSLFNGSDRSKYFSSEDSQLELCMNKIIKGKSKELFNVYLKQSPQVSFSKNNSIVYNAIKLGADGIKSSLLYIFSNIQKNILVDEKNNRVCYFHKDKYYLPTSIASGDEFDLAKNILNNPYFIENTYEISILIGGKKCPNINNLKHELDKYYDNDLDPEYPLHFQYTSKDRISKVCNDLKLTSINNIIGKLND